MKAALSPGQKGVRHKRGEAAPIVFLEWVGQTNYASIFEYEFFLAEREHFGSHRSLVIDGIPIAKSPHFAESKATLPLRLGGRHDGSPSGFGFRRFPAQWDPKLGIHVT